MKNILTENDIMKQYTELIFDEINKGMIMKANRGSNSMYETETHFEPVSSEFQSMIIALERKPMALKEMGFGFSSDVSIYELVVKNVKSTFDDGEILYSKRFFRLTDYGKYFYVDDVESAREIEDLRRQRWHANNKSQKRTIKSNNELVELVNNNRGFKNAKPEDLVFERNSSGYIIKNNSLKTKPELQYKF